MADVYERDGAIYTASNRRMRYDPEFCENHEKTWSEEDLEFLCGAWKESRKADMALALDRTHSSVLTKVHRLRKQGRFDGYSKRYWEAAGD